MLRSRYMKQYVFFLQMQSQVLPGLVIRGCVLYFGFFTSCVWHLIPCQIKNSPLFGNVVFVVLEVYNRFDGFRTNLFEKVKRLADATKTKTQTFYSVIESVQKYRFELCSACFCLVRSSRDRSSWSATCFGCDISCLFCFSVSATSMPYRTWEVALVSVSEVFWTERLEKRLFSIVFSSVFKKI